ncbi:TetR family transcriptional regulator [Burkholderia pseudomallei]|uniref:TetR/AcrR family transcriptional regulator n=1 Tax=Burkholderia pseudomallei TaxID=28450 RepID=UPI001AD674D8|nr:TetR/AcrR family transcriptional regulator [Burkholderia pseudomallei]MBO7908283.1 TetR family transcriptional regulator [Burkholderia pseudomallei]
MVKNPNPNMSDADNPSPPSSEAARSRIIAAALKCFSSVGFEGATLRQIADEADVLHQLVVYHFKNKETLWRAVVSEIFRDSDERFSRRLEGLQGVDPGTTLRLMLRDVVRFSAAHPEFHRLMTLEGRNDSPRLRWMLEEHVRKYYEMSTRLIRAAQEAGMAKPGNPGELHYATLGLITAAFSLAPEFRLLTQLEPFSEEHVERTYRLACDFLMTDASAGGDS